MAYGSATGRRPPQIVGVAADTHADGLTEKPKMTLYRPDTQANAVSTLLVRTAGSAEQLTPRVVETIRSLDPNRPVDHVQTLEELRDETIAPQRLNATLIGLFALLALAIAMVGVGGVLAFSVSQRTNELGIRMALGAEPGSILRMILGEGAVMAAIGLVIGGLLSAPLSRMLDRPAVRRAAARCADDRGRSGAARRRRARGGVGAGAPGDGGRADGRAAPRVTSRPVRSMIAAWERWQ